jgi:hypothetical protein
LPTWPPRHRSAHPPTQYRTTRPVAQRPATEKAPPERSQVHKMGRRKRGGNAAHTETLTQKRLHIAGETPHNVKQTANPNLCLPTSRQFWFRPRTRKSPRRSGAQCPRHVGLLADRAMPSRLLTPQGDQQARPINEEAANPPFERQAAKLVSKSNTRQDRQPDGVGTLWWIRCRIQILGLRSAPAWC